MPTVVAAGGWCYTKEIVLPHLGAHRQRGWSPVPRGSITPGSGRAQAHVASTSTPGQISDYKNALSYVESRDDVQVTESDRSASRQRWTRAGPRCDRPAGEGDREHRPGRRVHATMKRVHGETRFVDFENACPRGPASSRNGSRRPHRLLVPQPERGVVRVGPSPGSMRCFTTSRTAKRHSTSTGARSSPAELLLNYSVFPYLKRILDTRA